LFLFFSKYSPAINKITLFVTYFRNEISKSFDRNLKNERRGDAGLDSSCSAWLASPEIEGRDEVEVGDWAKHKKTFYSE
jgi:hypothetical protein